MTTQPSDPKPPEEMCHPYCGGCGHIYFASPKIPLSEARERARTLRCHYCWEDQKEDEKRRGDR